jgi:hypothetical protein
VNFFFLQFVFFFCFPKKKKKKKFARLHPTPLLPDFTTTGRTPSTSHLTDRFSTVNQDIQTPLSQPSLCLRPDLATVASNSEAAPATSVVPFHSQQREILLLFVVQQSYSTFRDATDSHTKPRRSPAYSPAATA